MFDFISKLFVKNYESLNGDQFRSRWNASSDAVLLDVRSSGEFKSGSIPGAKNTDVMSTGFKGSIAKLDKSKEYFLFCRSGARSAGAAGKMAAEGFKVINLKGGISAWKQNGD